MATPGWTVTVEMDADLTKVPDGPQEAALYGWQAMQELLAPGVVVTHVEGDVVRRWLVDLEDGSVTEINNENRST